MSDNKEVSTNDYGIPDAEYAAERQAARNAAQGIEETPEVETPATVEVETPEPPATEQAAPVEAKVEMTEVEKDPLEDFPEELRDRVASLLKAEKAESERYKRKYDSDIGRITSYQTKYEEARREKQEIEKQLAALKKTPPKSLKDLAPGPRIKEALVEDEVLVETLDELRGTIRDEVREEFQAELAQLRKSVEPLNEHRQREEQERFTSELDTKVENWREIVYDVHDGRITVDDKGMPVFSEAWATYINDQPPKVQEAILNPTRPQEALWALQNYYEWGVRKGYIQSEETPRSESVTNVPNADAIQKKRQDDLKRSAPPKQTQVPLGTPVEDQPGDPAWEARMRAKAREAINKGDLSILTNAR